MAPRETYFTGLIILCLLRIPEVFGSITVTGDASQTPASVSEWSVTPAGLVDILCTDSVASAATDCTCSVKSTQPAGGPFDVQKNPGDQFPRIYYTGTGLSSSGVTTYSVFVTCVGANSPPSPSGVTADLTVLVTQNLPPVFNVYPSVMAGSVSALRSNLGDVIYTAIATDPDGNDVTYSMTQSPDGGFFALNAATGAVRIAKSLLSTSVSTFTLVLSACDVKQCGRTQTVTVPITDLNTAPRFQNLPSAVNVAESARDGTVVKILTVADAEGDPIDTTCSVSPPEEAYKFKFVFQANSLTIRLATLTSRRTVLDYDGGVTKYVITCLASDGFLSSKGVLTVNVQNINEPPEFPQTRYYCHLDESPAGVSRCILGLSATDPDFYSYDYLPGNALNSIIINSNNNYYHPANNNNNNYGLTYRLLPGNHSERFSYVESADQLTFAVDYDVDDGAMPQMAVLTVEAKDPQGLTATSQIVVNVADVNDNTCRFASDVLSATVHQGSTLGSLPSFVATDRDLTSPNNDVTFESAGGTGGFLYVFSSGQVQYSQQIPDWEHGQTYYLQVRCVDHGTPIRSSTATFALTYVTTTTSTTTTTTTTASTPTTTTTTASPTTTTASVWNDSGFVAVFATLMALLGLLALAGLLAYVCGCCAGGDAGRCLRYPDKDPLRRVRPFQDDADLPRRSSSSREMDFYRGNQRYGDGRQEAGRLSAPVTPSGILAIRAPRS